MPRKMDAAYFSGPEKIELARVSVPKVGADQVRVKLRGCGVCASNLPVWQGREYFKYPFEPGAPGHEGWGIVDQCGRDVENVEPGQPVAIISYNAYAEYDVAEKTNVVPLPRNLAEGPFPAEPLGCAVNILKRCGIKPGDRVAIVGVGFIGALLTSMIAAEGNSVIAISRRGFALETAKKCGAEYTFAFDDPGGIVEQVEQITQGAGCDVVIEAVGSQGPLDLATKLTAIRGRLVVAGYHQDGMRQVNMQLWNWRGIDVVNAHERNNNVYVRGINEAIELVENGTIPLDMLLTNSYRLDQLDRAMQDMLDRPWGYLKGYINE